MGGKGQNGAGSVDEAGSWRGTAYPSRGFEIGSGGVRGRRGSEGELKALEGPEGLQLQLWLLHSRLGEVGKLKALVWHLVQKCLEMCCRVSTFFLKDGVLSSMAKSKECLFYNPKLFHLLMFSFCLMLV